MPQLRIIKRSAITVSVLSGALVGIYTYLGLHLYGLKDPYFVAKYTYTIAGTKIPYFSRMIDSSAMMVLSTFLIFIFIKNKQIKDFRIFNILLFVLLGLAGLLSYLYQ